MVGVQERPQNFTPGVKLSVVSFFVGRKNSFSAPLHNFRFIREYTYQTMIAKERGIIT